MTLQNLRQMARAGPNMEETQKEWRGLATADPSEAL